MQNSQPCRQVTVHTAAQSLCLPLPQPQIPAQSPAPPLPSSRQGSQSVAEGEHDCPRLESVMESPSVSRAPSGIWRLGCNTLAPAAVQSEGAEGSCSQGPGRTGLPAPPGGGLSLSPPQLASSSSCLWLCCGGTSRPPATCPLPPVCASLISVSPAALPPTPEGRQQKEGRGSRQGRLLRGWEGSPGW